MNQPAPVNQPVPVRDLRIEVLRPSRDGLPDGREPLLQRALVTAIPDLRVEEMFRLRPGLLREYDHLVLAWRDGAGSDTGPGGDTGLVGLLGCNWRRCPPLSLLHVGIQMIAPEYRRRGAFVRLWAEEIIGVLPGERQRPSMVVVKTYNPVVYLAMRGFARLAGGRLYPEIGAARDRVPAPRKQEERKQEEPEERDRELATRVSALLAPEHHFDTASGVVRGIGLPPDLYEGVPHVRGHPVERYFEQHLRPGDRLLCLLRLPGFDEPDSAQRLFARLAAVLGPGVPIGAR